MILSLLFGKKKIITMSLVHATNSLKKKKTPLKNVVPSAPRLTCLLILLVFSVLVFPPGL